MQFEINTIVFWGKPFNLALTQRFCIVFVIAPRVIWFSGVVKYLNVDFNKPEHICDSLNQT